MTVTVGSRYVDCGYRADVPKGAIGKAPNASVWRRTLTVARVPDNGSSFVPVVARWEYVINNPIGEHGPAWDYRIGVQGEPRQEGSWMVATERNIEVPATSLGNRFIKIENRA